MTMSTPDGRERVRTGKETELAAFMGETDAHAAGCQLLGRVLHALV
jgi:hypothetical protein